MSVVDTLHGRPVADPYRWLEDPDSPATRGWLADRSREFARATATWPMRDRLARQIRRLVATELWSPPVHRGGLAFTTRRDADADHPRLVTIRDGRERVVFDPAVHDPSGRTTLDAWEPSPDGRLVAVQTSTGGTERGALRVLSADSGLPVEEPIRGVRYSQVAWLPAPHHAAFYYVRRDSRGGRPGVWLHRVLAVPRVPDILVHSTAGPCAVPGVRLVRGRWLLLTENHGTGHRTDLWIADLSGGRARAPRLRPVHVGEDIDSEADVGPDGRLYLRTTLQAPRRRICAADPRDPAPERWREIVPEDPGATLDAFTVTGTPDALELLVTRNLLGISELTAHDAHDGRRLRRVELPGEGMVTRLEADAAPDTAYFCYADVATQQKVLVLDHGARRPRPWTVPAPDDTAQRPASTTRSGPSPRTPVPIGRSRGSRPRRRTIRCRSADGTSVPVTLFSARPFDEPGPTILHAYGGFGRARRFGFSATVLSWLLAGGRYAVAHVRGGGDAGQDWHMRGARRNKIRSVQDLVAAADTLVDCGYCSRGQLCLSGGSAGGLLVLAAATMRPDLCAAVIASAPLADMARFEQLGLGRLWTREFGTTADPVDFAALMSYSPYHRALRSHGCRYPAVLLTGFHGDTRTDAAHPRKMCAALSAATSPDRPVLLRYERDVGHGPRAVTSAIELAADAHAFAAARTGLSPRIRSV
ncbi:prolyl oligopeptidase [Nocardiopsis mwathae]|uniref:prolyl oligopeptidase n=1 Tax=Nocardiopsis mwathae TaxID=1472723 RepID=A0A7X0D554_9ACTN|nr:prolyl oligopeptidase [Nocardiopsis mwathae]